MDIQQLTLVINLVKDIADGALWAFIIYLLVAHVLPYMVAVVVVSFVFMFFRGWLAAAYDLPWWKEQAAALEQSYDYRYDWSDVPKTKRLLAEKLNQK